MNEIIINGKTYVEKKITYKTVFILSMPNVGSWNGKWSGSDNLYCRVFPYKGKIHDEILGKNFYYNFGDGWGANVEVRKVESKEASKMKRNSKGFAGYDWMIASIVKNNCIRYEK